MHLNLKQYNFIDQLHFVMEQMLLERILSLCQRGRLNWDDCNIKKSSQFPFPAPPQFIEPSSWTPKQPSRRVTCSSAAAWNLGLARGSNQSKVVWAPAAAGMRGETHHIESICRIYWAQSVLSPLSLTHIRQMIKSSTPVCSSALSENTLLLPCWDAIRSGLHGNLLPEK